MLIRCPECAYTRQINEAKIPAGSEFATCPKCNCRFRFRSITSGVLPTDQAGEADTTEQANPAKQANPLNPADAEKSPSTPHTDVWSAVEDLNERWERDQDENSGRTRESGQDNDAGQAQEEDTDRLDEAAKGIPGQINAHDYESAEKPDKANPEGRQSGAGRPGLLANAGSVPWEYQGGFLHPLGLLRTIWLSFSRVPEFFGGIPALGSLVPALVFVLLMRGLQYWITFAVIKWTVVTEQGEQLVLTMAELTKISLPQLLITTLFIVVFLQFASTLIVNFMVRLVEPGRPNFNLTFKILAYSLSPLIFIILPQAGILLAEVGSLLLLTLGLRHAYRLSWGKTLSVMLPLILLVALINMNSLRLLS